jgi:[CysO sulfur-carrier protein]-S-L-cysteine hydrolase
MRTRERGTSVLTIESVAFQAMIRHAERETPREAVGMLAGDPSGIASRTLPLTNIAGPRAFLADPYSQYLAERRITAEGLNLIAIYHSHPDGGAHLSAADREFARLRDVINIVIAPAHRDCPLDVRGYRVRGERVISVPLRIMPA